MKVQIMLFMPGDYIVKKGDVGSEDFVTEGSEKHNKFNDDVQLARSNLGTAAKNKTKNIKKSLF